MTGVIDAGSFSVLPPCWRGRSKARSQTSLPVLRSKHSVNSFSFSNAVKNTKRRVRTGDDFPRRTGALHTTFFSLSNCIGNPVSLETPEPLGPRKRVQSSASALVSKTASAIGRTSMRRRPCFIVRKQHLGATQPRIHSTAGPACPILLIDAVSLPHEQTSLCDLGQRATRTSRPPKGDSAKNVETIHRCHQPDIHTTIVAEESPFPS